jgi:hypothetical protein
VQDHIKKDLLFVATEFGIYMTSNGGKKWTKLNGGLPNISFRDITIQLRENDLVAASFGRGFYVLDDMSALREFNSAMLDKEATLFNIKPAYWYIQKGDVYGQGDGFYKAKNPPYGANFTYYLKDKLRSLKEVRQEREKKSKNTDFPGWDKLEAEKMQQKPKIVLTIKDDKGNVVNTIEGPNKKGFNRINWKLDYPDKSGEKLNGRSPNYRITLATPGDYTVTLSKKVDGDLITLEGPRSFKVIPLKQGTLKGKSYEEINAFRKEYNDFAKDLSETNLKFSNSNKLIKAMENALKKADNPTDALYKRVHELRSNLFNIDKQLSGDKTKGEIGENSNPTPNSNSGRFAFILRNSSYGPTQNHLDAFNLSKKMLAEVKLKLDNVIVKLKTLKSDLKSAGAPILEEF